MLVLTVAASARCGVLYIADPQSEERDTGSFTGTAALEGSVPDGVELKEISKWKLVRNHKEQIRR